MNSLRKSVGILAVVFTLFALQNCFILDFIASVSQSVSKSSDSVQSLSKSVVSISASIFSSSSSDKDERKSYRKDVETLTAIHLNRGLVSEEFESDLASIARKNGVNNWKSLEDTYVSIGKGMRKAGVDTGRFNIFADEFALTRPKVANALRKGYASI
ncbi:putative lipoprotein [Leptospira fletcheri]|uniref:Putative lipoprotein n=1 Tax=Leptospira fletcheri TaxID=2484981 RepID=A0A4R9GFD0_9LEPT|nr:putative lipoprotein [Leptospira fletcheri]TGK10251.1 putative lipoprotein [Leptospira fletcheri]